MKFLPYLFKKKSYSDVEILNVGIEFAMEFGENWLQPIQNRLSKKIHHLSTNELDGYNKICQEAISFGNSFIYKKLSEICDKNEKISQKELEKIFKEIVNSNYAWISNSNLKRLFSQSIYYAWKDGLDSCIK